MYVSPKIFLIKTSTYRRGVMVSTELLVASRKMKVMFEESYTIVLLPQLNPQIQKYLLETHERVDGIRQIDIPGIPVDVLKKVLHWIKLRVDSNIFHLNPSDLPDELNVIDEDFFNENKKHYRAFGVTAMYLEMPILTAVLNQWLNKEPENQETSTRQRKKKVSACREP